MTLKIENFESHKSPLVEAILRYGNVNRFANALGVSRQVVDGWLYNCKFAPPPQYCKRIEELTMGEFTRERLRPDLFGEIKSTPMSMKQKIEGCMTILRGLSEEITEAKDNKKRGL